jgi:hypothetical protein
MSVPSVEVERVERDTPCRAWEITLLITKNGERGHYQFLISDVQWREARDNPKGIADGDHGPRLLVEPNTAEVPA